MASQSDTVTVLIELPRAEYKRVEAQARKEHLPVSQVIPELVNSELRRRERARRQMSEASRSYRARLAMTGKLEQTPEEIFAELRRIREEVADELFPG
jgi:hypothetical protein